MTSPHDPAARPPRDLGTAGWSFAGRVVRWKDADTVVVDLVIDVGFEEMVTKRRNVRLMGVDAPETHSPDPVEREEARAATAYVNGIAPPGSVVDVTIVKPDKYGGRDDGRIVTADGMSVSYLLLRDGHAVPYDGGAR